MTIYKDEIIKEIGKNEMIGECTLDMKANKYNCTIKVMTDDTMVYAMKYEHFQKVFAS